MKEKVLKISIAVLSVLSVAMCIMLFVGVGIEDNLVTFLGFGLFFAFFIADGVVIVKFANRKHAQAEAKRKALFAERGIDPEIIAPEKDYYFFVDRAKGVFGTKDDGELYRLDDIATYRRLFSTIDGTTKYDKMSVRIFMNNPTRTIVIGPSFVRADYGSYEYSNKIKIIDKIINVLDEVTNAKVNAFLAENGLSPTEQFQYDGYVFGYDISKKIFYARSEYGELEQHPFKDYVNFDVVRDSQRVSKLDIGDAIIGALISGSVGAAIWGKSYAEYCTELTIHIVLDGTDIDYILAQRERLPINSPEVAFRERFIGNVVKALKTIDSRQ